MRIQYLSDVHLELRNSTQKAALVASLIAAANGADLLVVAGDVSPNVNTRRLFFEELAAAPGAWPLGVVFVAGNHDYWNSFCTMTETDVALAAGLVGAGSDGQKPMNPRVHVLQRGVLDLTSEDGRGVVVLGATLWTESDGSAVVMTNDFSKIRQSRRMPLTLNGRTAVVGQ